MHIILKGLCQATEKTIFRTSRSHISNESGVLDIIYKNFDRAASHTHISEDKIMFLIIKH